jgi:hypothetical protein
LDEIFDARVGNGSTLDGFWRADITLRGPQRRPVLASRSASVVDVTKGSYTEHLEAIDQLPCIFGLAPVTNDDDDSTCHPHDLVNVIAVEHGRTISDDEVELPLGPPMRRRRRSRSHVDNRHLAAIAYSDHRRRSVLLDLTCAVLAMSVRLSAVLAHRLSAVVA